VARVLGIETSCDETAAAIVVDGRHVESNVVASQDDVHRETGAKTFARFQENSLPTSGPKFPPLNLLGFVSGTATFELHKSLQLQNRLFLQDGSG